MDSIAIENPQLVPFEQTPDANDCISIIVVLVILL